ncbi:hypothetical protein [Arenimonas sp. MALMAid1274]|uniref:hypothetical protein n=1 Tax=Arenimonas sp. MALMAid1274 TaxID=3411630 RepID=UPI003BA042D7
MSEEMDPPPVVPKKSIKELTADVGILVRWAQEQQAGFIPETVKRVTALEEARMDVEIEEAKKVLVDLLKHVKGYTNLILALGYGGILTIWSNSAEIMLPAAFAGCGAAVILSLLIFICSEIAQTRLIVKSMRNPIAEIPEKSKLASARADKISNATYWPILILGFGGGFTMFLCYVGALIREAVKAWG